MLQCITDVAAVTFISLGLNDFIFPLFFIVAEVGFAYSTSLLITVAMFAFVVVVAFAIAVFVVAFFFFCGRN